MVVEIAVDKHTLIADAVTFRFVSIAGIFISHREANIDADCRDLLSENCRSYVQQLRRHTPKIDNGHP